MEFIEKWFHVDPDGGSGVLEVIWICVPLIIFSVVLVRKFFWSKFKREKK